MTQLSRPAAEGAGVRPSETRSRPLRPILATVFGVLALVLVAALAVSSLILIKDLDAYHDQREEIPAAARADALLGTTIPEPAASAFRRARAILHPGDRFAVVTSPSLDTSTAGTYTAGTYRLFSQHYLFPALAVASPSVARVVIVLGPRAGGAPAGFDPVLAEPRAWVGVRR
jgi:hypothetical protein